jgi:hypothetical protein
MAAELIGPCSPRSPHYPGDDEAGTPGTLPAAGIRIAKAQAATVTSSSISAQEETAFTG